MTKEETKQFDNVMKYITDNLRNPDYWYSKYGYSLNKLFKITNHYGSNVFGNRYPELSILLMDFLSCPYDDIKTIQVVGNSVSITTERLWLRVTLDPNTYILD